MNTSVGKVGINMQRASGGMIILCWITILLCTVLKFFGYREFEIPAFNVTINIWLHRFINLVLYNCNGVVYLLLMLKHKPNIKQFLINISIVSIAFIVTLFDVTAPLKFILEPLSYVLIGFLFIEDTKYKIILESLAIYIIMFVYQGLTMLYKAFNPNLSNVDFVTGIVLQIDYYAFMILNIKYAFKKGGYIYGYWKSIILVLSKRKRIKESVQQNKNDVSQEIGYKLFVIVLSITQAFLVGTICYFVNGVILEYILVLFSFFVMRHLFGKSYHADSVLACTTLAVLVFLLATRLPLPQWCSILCNSFIGCMVAYVMYIWYFYARYTKATGIVICKGMSKDNLIALSEFYNWTELEFNILCDYYVYIIRLECIAHKYDYSVDNIKKIKAKALKKLT